MKWFKHETDAHTNLKLQILIRENGLASYGYYWFLVELVGKEGEEFRVLPEKKWKNFAKLLLNLEEKEQEVFLQAISSLELIDKKSLTKGILYIPKLAERSDDYTKRVRRVSVQSSDNVHLEEKRRDKKRIEQNTPTTLLEKFKSNPLWKTLIKKYPDRDYDYQFNLMLDWWAAKNKQPKAISAFENWLKNTKEDVGLRAVRLAELSKQDDLAKQKMIDETPQARPETLVKLKDMVDNLKTKF